MSSGPADSSAQQVLSAKTTETKTFSVVTFNAAACRTVFYALYYDYEYFVLRRDGLLVDLPTFRNLDPVDGVVYG